MLKNVISENWTCRARDFLAGFRKKREKKQKNFRHARFPPGPGSHDGGKRRAGGLDGRGEFHEHGEDGPEHGGREDCGEKRCAVHSGVLSAVGELLFR